MGNNKSISSKNLRKEFLNFFKKRGHTIVASSSLIPEDPGVLLTTAGVQQFNLYLGGERDIINDFGNHHLTSCQKCFRTDDIEEVGDALHYTFFEMLGNWSIGLDEEGRYFKEGAINLSYEFLISYFNIPLSRIWITIFEGNETISEDSKSKELWKRIGVPEEKIKKFGIEENFWGPVAETGACGPCSEIHYDRGQEYGCGSEECGPNCPYCDRFIELWNLVFMEFYREVKEIPSDSSNQDTQKEYKYLPLPQKNVDTGMGLERLVIILQNKPSVYETDLFAPVIEELENKASEAKPYAYYTRAYRIIMDHMRGACFLITEGIAPSNLSRGYILRKVLRRSLRYARNLELPEDWFVDIIGKLIEIYEDPYPELRKSQEEIIKVVSQEQAKFKETLDKGFKEFDKLLKKLSKEERCIINGKEAFDLYQSYGFPLEVTEDLAGENGFKVDREAFEKAYREHQEISKKGAKKKFGGHGLEEDKPEEAKESIIKLHTATHLLHAALRQVLGEDVKQMGSDINEERLRFDFSFERKIGFEELQQIEELVNKKIEENLEVNKEEMSFQEALDSRALAFFKEKYPERVTVYSIKDSEEKEFSREICRGPHVKNTGELGKFKIISEKSAAKGIRRIKATLE